MVLAGLKSVDEKSQTQTLKSAHHSTALNWRRWLLVATLWVSREIRKIRIPGIVSGYGYDPGRRWSCTYPKDTIWVQLQLPTWSRWVTMVPHHGRGGSPPPTWHCLKDRDETVSVRSYPVTEPLSVSYSWRHALTFRVSVSVTFKVHWGIRSGVRHLSLWPLRRCSGCGPGGFHLDVGGFYL